MGGQFSRFDPVVAAYNASGEPFRIEGHCQSSCTLFLGIREVSSRDATLLFQRATRLEQKRQELVTDYLLGAYNSRLRSYLTSHH